MAAQRLILQAMYRAGFPHALATPSVYRLYTLDSKPRSISC